MLQRSVLVLGGNASRRRANTSVYRYLNLHLQNRKENVAEQHFLTTVAKAQRAREKQIKTALDRAAVTPRQTPSRRAAAATTGVAYQRNVKLAERELHRLAAARLQRVEEAMVAAAEAKRLGVAAPRPAAVVATQRGAAKASKGAAADTLFFRRLEASRAKRIAAVERLLKTQSGAPAAAEEDEEVVDAAAEAMETVEAVEAPIVETYPKVRAALAVTADAAEESDAAQSFLQRLEEEAQNRRAMIESAIAQMEQQPKQPHVPKRKAPARVTAKSTVDEVEEEPVEVPVTMPAPEIVAVAAPAPPKRAPTPKLAAQPKPAAPVVQAVVPLPPRLAPARSPVTVRTPQPTAPTRVVVQVPLATSTGLFRI